MESDDRSARNAPQPPPRPISPAESTKARGSLWSIVLAIGGGLILFLGFLPLAGAAMYVALGAGVIFVLLSAAAAFHYFVWGRWLGDAIRREVEEEEKAEQQLRD